MSGNLQTWEKTEKAMVKKYGLESEGYGCKMWKRIGGNRGQYIQNVLVPEENYIIPL